MGCLACFVMDQAILANGIISKSVFRTFQYSLSTNSVGCIGNDLTSMFMDSPSIVRMTFRWLMLTPKQKFTPSFRIGKPESKHQGREVVLI